MSAGHDSDKPARQAPSRPSNRRPLPWFLIGAGVVIALIAIAGGATALYLERQNREPESSPVPTEAGVTPSPEEVPSREPTSDDCEMLGRRLEQVARAGQVEAIHQVFDWTVFVDRAASGLEIDKAERESFEAGVRQGASQSISQRLADVGVSGGQFDYLRTVERDGRPRALCRLISSDGLVDFFEYLPVGRGETLRVGDSYVYSLGEDVSANLRRGLLTQAVPQNRATLESLTGAESDLVRHRDEFARLVRSHSQGRWQETLDIYAKLPESLQQDKYVLVNAVNAAMLSGGDRFEELVARFRTAHPDDPAIELLVFNEFQLKGQLDRSIAALRRLDEHLNGDAFVKSLMAGMLIEQEKYSAADALLREAIELEPDLPYPYIGLIGSAVASGDAAEAVERLSEMESVGQSYRGGRLDPGSLRKALAVYTGSTEFFASKEFAEWEAMR